MIGQPDPRIEAGRAGHAGGLRDDRMRPVGADDDRGGEGRRRPIGSSDGERAVVEIDRRDRPSPPDLGAGQRRPARAATGPASTGRTRPPARPRRPRRRSGERSRRPASRRASPGSAGRPSRSSAASEPIRRRADTAAGDANTPPARHCQWAERSRTTTGWPTVARRAASAAPAGPPPTIATPSRSVIRPPRSGRAERPGRRASRWRLASRAPRSRSAGPSRRGPS